MVSQENVLKLLYMFFYLKIAVPSSPHPKRFRLKKHCEIVIRPLTILSDECHYPIKSRQAVAIWLMLLAWHVLGANA